MNKIKEYKNTVAFRGTHITQNRNRKGLVTLRLRHTTKGFRLSISSSDDLATLKGKRYVDTTGKQMTVFDKGLVSDIIGHVSIDHSLLDKYGNLRFSNKRKANKSISLLAYKLRKQGFSVKISKKVS